jgi:hypothetical protein
MCSAAGAIAVTKTNSASGNRFAVAGELECRVDKRATLSKAVHDRDGQ